MLWPCAGCCGRTPGFSRRWFLHASGLACFPVAALHNLLGYPRVHVYDGSFTEWAERVELPVKVGDDP